MAIVIGDSTDVDFSQGTCVVSVQWGFNPNTQRLYCLDGTSDPFLLVHRPTETASVTIYAPGTPHSVEATSVCDSANQVSLIVSPGVCPAGTVDGVSGSDWFVTSYNYSREDAVMPGQESWSLQRWTTGGLTGVTLPTYIMRGIAEGQGTDDAGLVFTGETSIATTGQVSAGGFGTAYQLTIGQVITVGGGGTTDETGQGSASIPYTALYL